MPQLLHTRLLSSFPPVPLCRRAIAPVWGEERTPSSRKSPGGSKLLLLTGCWRPTCDTRTFKGAETCPYPSADLCLETISMCPDKAGSTRTIPPGPNIVHKKPKSSPHTRTCEVHRLLGDLFRFPTSINHLIALINWMMRAWWRNLTLNDNSVNIQGVSCLSYHVLIPVRPVLAPDLVSALQPLIGDGVPVDGGVVNCPGALPRHHNGCVILGIGLNIFRLWTAN